MGSFWGLDNAGKEAQGWPREYGADQSQQYKDWISRQNQEYSAGDAASQWYKDYQLNRVNNGVGSIADINAKGSMIMPGVQQYITDNQGRIQNQIDAFNQLPSATDTMAKINQDTSDKGALIRQTQNYNLQDIGDTYNREKAGSDDSWGKALANTELLKPGSQFQQAQTARSFAGQAAQTGGALRRSGIDPNSPQGIAAMQNVYTSRSRAMDDAAAAGTQSYVAANNAALLGQQSDRENLDATRSTQTQAQQNKSLQQASDWEDENSQNAMMDKALQTQDWQTRGDLQGQLSAAQLQAIGLNQQQFNAGMGYQTADLNERNAGAAGVGQYGQQQYDQANQSDKNANTAGNSAMSAYQTAYGYEAPQAGWGVKMLASMAAPAVAAIPGVGPFLSQAGTQIAGAQAAPVPTQGPNGQMSYQMPGSGSGSGSGTGGGQPNYAAAYQSFMNMFKKPSSMATGSGGTAW